MKAPEKVDFLLYRGERPKKPSDLLFFNPGVKVLINLQSGIHELVNEDENERTLWALRGVTEHTIPLSDWKRPMPEQLVEIVALIFIATHGKMLGTYIHCRHGVDRTGMVCAAYETLVLGVPPEKAIKKMHEKGFHRLPYSFLRWERSIREVGNNYQHFKRLKAIVEENNVTFDPRK